jgi:1-acyl-sn-glycerol-3-phosphate acyltransferase
LLSRHSSHLDGGAILAAIPFALWPRVYIGAAKDYFFTNRLSAFFFTHCMMAIPIDRTVNRGAAVTTCLKLLGGGEPAWLLLFPEGSRHKSEGAPDFKRGVSIFSLETDTPLLFLHLENRQNLWPPGRFFSFPGSVDLYVGPIHPPASIAVIQESYDLWIDGLQTELKFS